MGDICSEIKGHFILKKLLEKYKIHLFGKTFLINKNLINHGSYTIENIRQKLIDNGINLILFISMRYIYQARIRILIIARTFLEALTAK